MTTPEQLRNDLRHGTRSKANIALEAIALVEARDAQVATLKDTLAQSDRMLLADSARVVALEGQVATLREALADLPDDFAMIEHNPDEGESFYCCGAETRVNVGLLQHKPGCWYVAARAALASTGGKS